MRFAKSTTERCPLLKSSFCNSLTNKRKKDRFLDPPVFERKTVPHPHFEVTIYQSHCKRTIPLYHALVMREERWITQLFQELFNTQQR